MGVQATSTMVRTAPDHGPADQLGRMAFSAVALGDWPRAFEMARACLEFGDPEREHLALAYGEAVAGLVAAVRGDSAAVGRLLDCSERSAVASGRSDLLDMVQLGRGVDALSVGRYDEAFARLRQLVTSREEPSALIRLVAVGFLAETGLHTGCETVADIVTSAVAQLAPSSELVGPTAYARAMAGTVRFDRALAECPADRVFDRARINLARGVLLRRERKILESRSPLQEALVGFERLGAAAWAEHARRELRATGARHARRELGAIEALTEQELQIVRLAAAGMTNREIGQRLYLSHRTIGSHLYRAFPKLGIAARSQLRDVLAELADREATSGRLAH